MRPEECRPYVAVNIVSPAACRRYRVLNERWASGSTGGVLGAADFRNHAREVRVIAHVARWQAWVRGYAVRVHPWQSSGRVVSGLSRRLEGGAA